MRGKVDRSAMRIASSLTLRIAAGLLLAVLPSVVGHQVFRRLNSQGPEALLERAEGLSWLGSEIQTKPTYIYEEQRSSPLPVAQHARPTSRLLHVAISSISIARHGRSADPQLTPNLVWHQFTLSRVVSR